ncbi:uncharacterized protein LOC142166874 [Nicotiana tabacum]|uniref:Uncharacterized protein LOC142166874 n=1 Tax=Nicotiana tabacum TaxID=4097 RepID=A0AC58SC82_TOBAC
MEPWQDINKLEEYRRKLGIHSAFADMNVYAKCDAIERIELWDSMYHLTSDMESPWLVGGYFNIILSEEEKYGRRPVYPSEVEDFAHCVDTCALFLANQQFQDLLSALEVEHLIKYGSDHALILLSCNINSVQENWLTHSVGNPFIMFQNKLKNVKKALADWSKETFGYIFKQIAALEDVIKVHEVEFELNPTTQNKAKLHKVEADLTRLYHLEEEFWRQKDGLQWFKYGDRNTNLIHAHVKGKRKRLQVSKILDNNGNWIETWAEMARKAVDLFQAQFTKERIPTNFDIIQNIPRMIFDDQNERLWEEPTMVEVKATMFGLNGNNASGPDGFTRHFYQAC